MKQIFLSTILAIFCFHLALAQTMVVVDEENFPLPAACVFDNNGAMLGITNDNGEFDLSLAQFYPLTIKTAGMSDAVVEAPQEKVVMKFRLMELPEVTFSPKDRPVMHVVAYARETMSSIAGKDTSIVLKEFMVDYFVATEKCKFKSILNPRQRNVRTTVLKKTNAEKESQDMAFENLPLMVSIPGSEIKEHDDLVGDKTGVASKPAKKDKYEIKCKKTPLHYMENMDPLASKPDHKLSLGIFKLLGMSLVFTDLEMTFVFENNKATTHSAQDLVSLTANLGINLGGKRVNKEYNTENGIEVKGYIEMYPVSRTYLTEDEAKVQSKNNSKIEFEIPEAAKN